MNLLEEAIIYSTIMHQGKTRKGSGVPYILHPIEVAQILSTMTTDQEVIAAGVLHDIVEDTDGTLPEIRSRFGDRVAELVASETEYKYPGEDRAASWRKRKEESLRELKNTNDKGIEMLWLADKLSNIRSLAGIYGEKGEQTWSILNQKDPAQQQWYYQTIAEYLEMDLNRTGSYKEFIQHINYIWPGTFNSQKSRYKKYREVSIDGCPLIGKGAQGMVYRYDDELIVKVYNNTLTYKDVENETEMARKAFVMGLPTAISFGIVSVGSQYGAMYELVEAQTISELLSLHPGNAEYYGKVMANMAHEIHAVESAEGDGFPDSRETLLQRVNRCDFAGDDALVAYDKFQNRIAHVHLKDRVAPDDMHCVPAGSGCIPIAPIVHDLVASGYDGWLTVEQYGSRQMLADSKTAFANVRAILEKK